MLTVCDSLPTINKGDKLTVSRCLKSVRSYKDTLLALILLSIFTAVEPRHNCFAFSQSAKEDTPQYEVASVRPSINLDRGMVSRNLPDGLFVQNASLGMLLRQAYGEDYTGERIIGMPLWAKEARFDITAKVDPSQVVTLERLMGSREEQIKRWQANIPSVRMRMLQQLLRDRFGLEVHHENRKARIILMLVDKKGSRLTTAHEGDTYNKGLSLPGQKGSAGLVRTLPNEITAQGIPMGYLAKLLSTYMGRTVLDGTSLKENYDFTLRWSSDANPSQRSPSAEITTQGSYDEAASLETAVKEQLGLRLQVATGDVDHLVIDRVERPSEN
jgi:uncharacterized protein (TIGR03435 family)